MTTSIANVHDIEWYGEVPRSIRRHALVGLALILAVFGGFGTWAATAPLAAAVISAGSFVATGENKVVQHLEGGIIQEILVSEGDHVTAGRPLIRLDGIAAQVKQRQLFLRQARLEANAARLSAQVANKPEIKFPDIIIDNRNDSDISSIVDGQIASFRSAQSRVESEVGLLKQNMESLKFRAEGFRRQSRSMSEQLSFLQEEYAGKLKLLNQGLMRKPEVNAIQRAIADAQGQIGRLNAEVAETDAQVEKFRQQIDQTITELNQKALDELQSSEGELDAVREEARQAQNIMQRSTINAPVSGTVVRMYYHTSGGVIESGKKILEILPANVPLIIETQIQRKDIDAVKPGQRATIHLVALNRRTTPVLYGDVYYVSADALSDAALPNTEVYLARIRLSASELARIPGFTATPGMPVEVMIETAERTFLDYLTKPIRESMSRAFTER
ncbi:HlyD family type I secretion periplasmic adaptor subunit [Mesorhizobium retamae]|uniref:Membrane fusion protein (MFP) family protein n=1 Tax=Mesorhizobium retamae TaxID=2912854 RepID=A0ABS9QLZ3_9HYPH|nr:HlyD family type I secretion periplasmic adaptor subunit [Mesorhizobium sp. IRAMC:0171]MCG7507756.1 HlyD family type I secretion periplasmic adaptor subunit [Mesorhizobium sp. IRAMC:0171]